MSDIVIFESDAQQIEVRLEGEMFWVSQAQMAELFDTSSDNISLHLKNIYKEEELEEKATTEDFSVVRQEGIRLTLDENGLTALTLLIAASDPKAKDLMVRLLMNLLAVGSGAKRIEDA